MTVNASARQGNDTIKEVWPCNPGPAAWSFDQNPILDVSLSLVMTTWISQQFLASDLS